MPALIVDPELVARVTRQFQLRGALEPFNLTENVVPIFDIGQLLDTAPTEVVTPDSDTAVRVGVPTVSGYLPTLPVELQDAQLVSGAPVNPAANAIIADSGQLAAGPTAIWWSMSTDDPGFVHATLEWRNAANTADLAAIEVMAGHDNGQGLGGPLVFDLSLNERVRIETKAATVGIFAGNIQFAPVAQSIA